MNRSILLLADCGTEIGFGHLTRCLSLAHVFREAGWQADLWVATDELTRPRLPSEVRPMNWYDLPVEAATEAARADALVVDSYALRISQVEKIAAVNSRLVIIDDFHRYHYQKGIVVDWTLGAEDFAYPNKSPNVLYLLGSKYCTMRPEFSLLSGRTFAGYPGAVLVTFGGSDIRRLTGPVVSMLNQEFSAWRVDAIVGAGVKDRSFMSAIGNGKTTFHEACDAGQMRALMSKADIAICAGGQTLYELASQGLPPLVVSVADNQQDDIREFAKIGFALEAGDWNSPTLLFELAKCIRKLRPAEERSRRSSIGRRHIDGQGGQRLVAACLKHWQTTKV